jgi:hypothetical protein
MTTFSITFTPTEEEIVPLLEALKHYAGARYEWLMKEYGGSRELSIVRRELSIGDILHICRAIIRLEALNDYRPLEPIVLSEDEADAVEMAIKDYTAVCEQQGSNMHLQCDRPYSELPAVLAAILPRLEYGENWTQTSGHIPGDEASGKPSTIWIKG